MAACEDPFLNQKYLESTNEDLELSNAEFLNKNKDEFSLWIELLQHADLYNALNDANSVSTVFAPNNEAVEGFLEWRGVSSVLELDEDYALSVAQVHVMKDVLSEDDFVNDVELGSIPVETLFGNYLSASYGFMDLDVDDEFLDNVVLEDSLSIYLNNQAKVANLGQATITANGIVYTMEDVIHPLAETIVDVLRQYDEFNIFIEAMEKTGYDEITSVYADSVLNLDGSVSVNDVLFTCMAVPDEVYNYQGITTVDDLISYLGAGSNYADNENKLYQYIAYHFMGNAYSKARLSVFQEEGQVQIYDTKLSGQVITVQSENGSLKINGVATFIRSNIEARNGYIHKINHLLPVYEPAPLKIVWDFCNSSDIESFVNSYGASRGLGELFSSPISGKEYQIDLSEDQLEGNYGTITAFDYTANDSKTSTRSYRKVGFFKCMWDYSDKTKDLYGAYMNNLFILNLGYAGNITLQTPTIIKGKYKVVFYYAGSPGLKTFYTAGSNTRFNLDDFQETLSMWKGIPGSFIDEDKQSNIYASGIASDVLWDEITFETSDSHTFKATMMDINAKTNSSYRQMWDYMEFIPIEE
jgi:uncharacterized surface protein with fasciclin (FAS1) repeats